MPSNRLILACVYAGHTEVIPAQLVLVSIGYKSLPIEGAPFDSARGTIPNTRGKVHACTDSVDSQAGQKNCDIAQSEQKFEPGLYVCGWLKRGPTGIIGTNAVDAEDTVSSIMQDLKSDQDQHGHDSNVENGAEKKKGFAGLRELLIDMDHEFTTFSDWLTIDSVESEVGERYGKIREKITDIDEMLNVVHG